MESYGYVITISMTIITTIIIISIIHKDHPLLMVSHC